MKIIFSLKKIICLLKRFLYAGSIGLLTAAITWNMSSPVLSAPGNLYAHYYGSDINIVREVQLLLALNGYYHDRIDGVFGEHTKAAIIEYQNKNNLFPQGIVNEALKEHLYQESKYLIENDKSKTSQGSNPNTQETNDAKTIMSLSAELDKVKADIQNTNTSIKGMNDGIADHFIGNFRDVVSVVAAGLGIALGLFGFFAAYLIQKILDGVESRLNTAHERMLKESEAKLGYRIFVNLSNSSYLDYKALLSDRSNNWFKIAIGRAIWFADAAIAHANKMPDGEEKYNMIKYAESHRAYHYASESLIPGLINNSHQSVALGVALQLKEFADELIRNNKIMEGITCKDTVAWILILLGDTTQKDEGKTIIRDLITHYGTMHSSIINEIRENYTLIPVTI